MVETIAPVVHGGRNRSYYRAVALHTVGATVAAGTLGLVLGLLGFLIGAPFGTLGQGTAGAVELGTGASLAVALVAGAYSLRELAGVPVPLPDLDRQVPDWWRTFYSPGIASLLYGLGLGIGFLTYLSFGTLVPVAVASLLLGEPLVGAALMAPFGAARGLSVLIAARGDREPEAIVDALRQPSTRRVARLANGAALVSIVLVALLTL